MDIGEAAARSVDWSAFEHMTGEATQFGDSLADRCRRRALKGVWLLVRLAVTGSEVTCGAILEVLRLVDPAQAEALSSWSAA
jgi:hypothetical protein